MIVKQKKRKYFLEKHNLYSNNFWGSTKRSISLSFIQSGIFAGKHVKKNRNNRKNNGVLSLIAILLFFKIIVAIKKNERIN